MVFGYLFHASGEIHLFQEVHFELKLPVRRKTNAL